MSSKHPIAGSRVPRRFGLSVLLLPSLAAAAGVTVTVTDGKGQPAADAVVLLETGSGRAPVKPLPQLDVAQVMRQFKPRVTVVTTGTPVNFPNFDTVRHHVFSDSPAKSFELKLYAGVPARPVIFDKPGIVVLGCNIHDQMGAWIVVSDTPWYGLAGADGRARIDNVPPGNYSLRTWHPALPGEAGAATLQIKVGANDMQQAVELNLGRGP